VVLRVWASGARPGSVGCQGRAVTRVGGGCTGSRRQFGRRRATVTHRPQI